MIHDLKRTTITENGEVRKRRIYIAGPMSNIPYFNFPAFLAKADELRGRGWEVFCPAENDIDTAGWDFSPMCPTGSHSELAEMAPGINYRTCMKADLSWICDKADAIYMMKGWEHSIGARTEWSLAQCMKLETIYD